MTHRTGRRWLWLLLTMNNWGWYGALEGRATWAGA